MTRTERLFDRITARPFLVLATALVVIIIAAAGLARLEKNTSLKAFIPANHDALVTDARATEIFGLSDSIAIAIIARDGTSVFEPETLALIAELSDQMSSLPNVRYGRIASLATESSISGSNGSVSIDPYIDVFDLDERSTRASRERWRSMTPHQGTLVSDDEQGALIMAELLDADKAATTYQAVIAMVSAIEAPDVDIHVAGPGAVSGYLSRYIDQDARKLVPLAFLLILVFIYLAFRRAKALPGPLLVVLGSTAGALGIMAWCDISFYAITNALPIVIVAISVADAIHILSAYYKLRAQDSTIARRILVLRAMGAMARPITLTTLTTIAGFVGIAAMSIMPPITYFAVFAALGVVLAWIFSIFALPCVLTLFDPGQSPAFANWRQDRPSQLGRVLASIASFSMRRYRYVLSVFVLIGVIAGYGASQLRVDRSQVENFTADEPIRIADELLNQRFAGTAFLDILVEGKEPDALLKITNMRKIRDLQQFFETLPHVSKTVSIVDYVSQLHGAIEELSPAELQARRLPNSDSTLAETLFVYEISGDPADLEEEIDADYQRALVRGVLDAHYFSQNRIAVEALQLYLDQHFSGSGLSASLTGDVNVSYQWMKRLQVSHFNGVILSLVLVFIASVLVFRSPAAGVIAVLPVVFTVLTLYACMGYLDIYLEPATSMFAAIALGVGVDFAIHLVDRLRSATRAYNGDLAAALNEALPPIARACFYNAAALGLGFAVLTVSDLPTLKRFGGLIALAAFASYLTALLIVPALFAAERSWRTRRSRTNQPARIAANVLAIVALGAGFATDTQATPTDADSIARAVADRTEGVATRRLIDMTLTRRSGRIEQRKAIVHKLNDSELRTTRITFVEPKKSRDVSFLSHDYRAAERIDKRWMFLPAARKARQVPASQRGKSFLGTDFSYEDMQSELKFNLNDWRFGYDGEITIDGQKQYRLTGVPKDERTARELGYGGFAARIDATTWMPVSIEFVDVKSRPLKTIEVNDIARIDDIWTARDIVATNHQTGHTTRFVFRDIHYLDELNRRLFEPQALTRGLGNVAGH